MEHSTLFFNQIPASIIEAQDLNDFEKLLFGEIYTMANSYGSIFPSNTFLAKRYKKSVWTVSTSLKKLQDKGYIKMEYQYKGKEILKRFIYPCLDKSQGGIVKNPKTPCEKSKGGIVKNPKGNISSNISINKSINNTMSGKPDNVIPYSEIISYLNEKAGTKYRATGNKTQTLIKSRFKEGFNIDDFKQVVDIKCDEWGKDEKMSKFLRPETLFGTKFESYLNQKPVAKSTKSVPDWAKTKYEKPKYTEEDLI